MRHSDRALEGYLLIDHSQSPGLPAEMAHAVGLPAHALTGTFEAPTITCPHCSAIAILNPNRTTAHLKCWQCDRKLCRRCELAYRVSGGACRSMARTMDTVLEAASR